MSPKQNSTMVHSVAEVVSQLVQASQNGVERRASERHAFFAPVSLTPLSSPTQRWSAFSRDVSGDGVGLLHNMPIDRGAICELSIKSGLTELRHEAECVWCGAAGEGWYLSGWRFVPPKA